LTADMIAYPHFDPVIFKVWIITVRWYALAYIAGILLGWWYVLNLAKRADLWAPRAMTLTRDNIDDLVLYITLGVIVGGRLGSVLFYNTSMIWKEPLEIIRIDHGGMSFHGGLIGVAVAMLVFARVKKFSVLAISDLVATCVPIGLFFGRIANFVNNELWGRETSVPWAFVQDKEDPIGRHPSQLYEAALEGVVLFIILRLATHRYGQLKRPGAVTGLFLVGYGVFRMVVETVREPDSGWLHDWPLGLTMGMLLSLLMFIPGVWLFWKSRTAAVELAEPVPAPVTAPPVTPPIVEGKPAAKAKAAPKTAPKAAIVEPARKAPAPKKPAAPKSAAKKPAGKTPAKPKPKK
jgi:phosphatidylglycerol:prolipoprotein diacylglycerol transferase